MLPCGREDWRYSERARPERPGARGSIKGKTPLPSAPKPKWRLGVVRPRRVRSHSRSVTANPSRDRRSGMRTIASELGAVTVPNYGVPSANAFCAQQG